MGQLLLLFKIIYEKTRALSQRPGFNHPFPLHWMVIVKGTMKKSVQTNKLVLN